MEIIALTDIHSRVDLIDKISWIISTADLLIITGDITHFGGEKEAKYIMEKLEELNPAIIAVPGNCDYPEVNKYLYSKNWNIHGNIKQINGYSFLGLGCSLPCPGKTPCEFTEEEYNHFITTLNRKMIPESQKILVSHQPPSNTINDKVTNGQHVGSAVIRDFIEQIQPIMVFTGHIHEGVGIDSIGKSKIINPGPFREGNFCYTKIFDGQVIELEIRKV